MITRKTSKLIADAYGMHFKRSSGIVGYANRLYEEKINTFFYEQEYEVWFLQIMRPVIQDGTEPKLVKAIMELHTGETITSATKDWTYDQRQELGQKLLRRLAEDLFKLYENIPVRQIDYSKAKTQQDFAMLEHFATFERPAAELLERLKSHLEMDGYVYKDGHLYPTESSVIDEQAEQSYLELLIDAVHLPGIATIKHHLKLSEEHYVNGRHDDSISNSRKVLDAVLKQIAEEVHLKMKKTPISPAILKNATDTRVYLEKQGLITTAEREALDKTYGVLSVTGGHPYIAEKDQARLMRHQALTYSQFVILRYQGFLSKNP